MAPVFVSNPHLSDCPHQDEKDKHHHAHPRRRSVKMKMFNRASGSVNSLLVRIPSFKKNNTDSEPDAKLVVKSEI